MIHEVCVIMYKFMFIIVFVSINSCKTRDISDKSASRYDHCMNDKDYTWNNGYCVPRNSLLTEEQRCLAYQDGRSWVDITGDHIPECVTASDMNKAKQTCLARGDGSIWKDDHCVSPELNTQSQEGKAFCEAKSWIWTATGRCISQEEASCQKKTGYEFLEQRCVGPNEATCMKRGYQRTWTPQKIGEDQGSCDQKSFMMICQDQKAPQDVKDALNSIMNAIKKTDCVSAYDQLSVITSLSLDGGLAKNIKTLIPLAPFSNIKSLSLSGNNITDVRMLFMLPDLEYLDLSHNEIQDLTGLENLTSVKTLLLSYNRIYRLNPLQKLSKLENLGLTKNAFIDLKNLILDSGSLKNLTAIILNENCQLKDISALKSISSLSQISLNFTSVPDPEITKDWPQKPQVIEYSLCP